MESSNLQQTKQKGPYRPPRSKKSNPPTSTQSPSSNSDDQLDILEKRRLRFLKSNVPKTGFGLVSRGEDFTLRDDPKSRIKLFNDIKIDLVKFQKDESLKDKILMSFRKLREGIIAGKERDNAFKIDVLMASFKFSVNIGHYQSYLPTINQLLWEEPINLPKEDYDAVILCYCIHLSHLESNSELALDELINHFKSHDFFIKNPLTINEIVYKLIVSNLTMNSIEWIRNFNKLETNSIYSNFLKSISLAKHQSNSLNMIIKCYKMLPLLNFKKWTNLNPENIKEFQNFKISIHDDKIVKFQRV